MSGLSVGGAGNNVAGIQVGSDSGALGISSFPKAESGEKSGAVTGFGAPVAGSPVEFSSGSTGQGKGPSVASFDKLAHTLGADPAKLASSKFGALLSKGSSSDTDTTGSTGQSKGSSAAFDKLAHILGADPAKLASSRFGALLSKGSSSHTDTPGSTGQSKSSSAAFDKLAHTLGADPSKLAASRFGALFSKGSSSDSSPTGSASTTGGIMAPQGQSVRALGEDLAKSRGASITGVHAALPAQTESDPIVTAKSGSTSGTGSSSSLGLVGEIKQLLAKLTKGESSQNLGSASSSTGIPAEVENSSV